MKVFFCLAFLLNFVALADTATKHTPLWLAKKMACTSSGMKMAKKKAKAILWMEKEMADTHIGMKMAKNGTKPTMPVANHMA